MYAIRSYYEYYPNIKELGVKGSENPNLLPKGAITVRMHSVGGWGAITTGKNLGAIIGDLNDLLYDRDKVVDEFGNPSYNFV